MAEDELKANGRATDLPRTPIGMPPATRQDNLLDWLFGLRDVQREQRQRSAWVIHGDEIPWEHNRQGQMKWYMHPALEDIALRTLIFSTQVIPPGGRTGAQRVPGGSVMYILKGRGFTLLDGVRHDWEAEDMVNIPIRSDGVTVQHVNLSDDEPVEFTAADTNLVDSLGVERGAAFEQVEDAPQP